MKKLTNYAQTLNKVVEKKLEIANVLFKSVMDSSNVDDMNKYVFQKKFRDNNQDILDLVDLLTVYVDAAESSDEIHKTQLDRVIASVVDCQNSISQENADAIDDAPVKENSIQEEDIEMEFPEEECEIDEEENAPVYDLGIKREDMADIVNAAVNNEKEEQLVKGIIPTPERTSNSTKPHLLNMNDLEEKMPSFDYDIEEEDDDFEDIDEPMLNTEENEIKAEQKATEISDNLSAEDRNLAENIVDTFDTEA